MSKMAKTTSTALALILALTTAPVMAQTTEEAAPAADAATTTPEYPTGQEVGAPADGPGSSYTAATFETWEQKCVRTEIGVDPCQLYLLLKDKTGNSVAEFTIFNLPKGSEGPAVAGATFVAPLETLLPTGMTMQIDGGKGKAYPFTFCTQIGCVARIGFTAEEITALKSGGNGVITIVPFVAPNEKVELTLSLKGFTAGYDAVVVANDKADAAAVAKGGEAAPADGAAPAEPAAPAAP
ncbi:MAG: invasion associated locus B family protein [Tabrizicola sp.]|jgi:invasion protein IalB|nr:invasion associated locus B family protein [Tabrizicola sp.]